MPMEQALVGQLVDRLRGTREAMIADLARRDARGATLRETLRVFLAHRRSHAAAARAMNLHRNSVQYRVRRATALLAAHWLGGAVLK
ncbi:helix-turn-helix domain-containing protein [Streptomyces sp. NPDC090023]|uniref:helix-turn-helix domain-containing protein n=1 Tax=unclassified Streptomyces TaxID=2593676 RepID=UPI00380622E3